MRTDTLLRWAAGTKGGIDRVVFTEGSTTFDCLIPDDSLWIAVKDNLLLSEYERCGIRLCDFTGSVIDAGAHVGLFSLKASLHATRVYAVEPHPFNCTLLGLNLARNAISNVTVMPKALWSSSGPVTLTNGVHSAANFITAEGFGEQVEAVTLEDILRISGSIDLLKLDVEGAEFEIIADAQGSILAEVNAIVGELHHDGRRGQTSGVLKKLRSEGFEVTVIDPPVEFWRDSLSRLFANWQSLRGHARLKTTILAAYSYAALERSLLRRTRSAEAGLAFLFARRRSR
jgi:FkbM family methyltransferase